MEKAKVKFTKEGRYSLHPAFGPTIDVLIGDEYTLNKSNADQIVADKWGEIIEEEVAPDADTPEPKWPTVIHAEFINKGIDEQTAKDLLMDRAEHDLEMDLNHMKSVANMVTEILIEMEIQEENDD